MLLKNDHRPHRRYIKVVYLTSTLFLAFFVFVSSAFAYTTDDISVYHFDDYPIGEDSANNYDMFCEYGIIDNSVYKYSPGSFWQDSIDHLYCGLSDPYNFNLSGGLTMGGWFKTATACTGQWCTNPYLSYIVVNGLDNYFRSLIKQNPNRIECMLDNESFIARYDFEYADDTWHNYVCVLDDNFIAIYVDGVQQDIVGHNRDLSQVNYTNHSFNKLQAYLNFGQDWRFDDLFFRKGVLTDDDILYIYTSQDAYTGEFEPVEEFLYNPPTIETPTELQQIEGTTVNVTGECWYPGINIIDQDTQVVYTDDCHYDFDAPGYAYHFLEKIQFPYDSGTGRPGGYVEFSVPSGYFAGLIRQDAYDVKIVPYNNDIGGGTFYFSELDYWFGTVGQDIVFKFYADDEPPGNIYPIRDYYLVYGFQFEDQAPTIIQSEPITDYSSTLGTTLLIKGDYNFSFVLPLGDRTITARSFYEFPQLHFTNETDPVHFTLLDLTSPPGYVWTQPQLWYTDITNFDEPTGFLGAILDTADGVLSPLMARINDFNTFFDTEDATADGVLLATGLKTVISYTKLFDNFFGSLPISWGLLLLMIVYVAKFVIIYTAKAIQTFKPL